ncbi:uncharacterized protein LOC118909951 [Manis pentadactyla]|uniref:uncharacterized protein LOC118909951 n=1 Tax=Manis pentadactyla TaxID=143292 RepID=UPI00255C87E4|nr:uncharacterized protein LOC118909951 [Manis pentadactyla]
MLNCGLVADDPAFDILPEFEKFRSKSHQSPSGRAQTLGQQALGKSSGLGEGAGRGVLGSAPAGVRRFLSTERQVAAKFGAPRPEKRGGTSPGEPGPPGSPGVGPEGEKEKQGPSRPPHRPHPATLPLADGPAAPRDHWPRRPSVRRLRSSSRRCRCHIQELVGRERWWERYFLRHLPCFRPPALSAGAALRATQSPLLGSPAAGGRRRSLWPKRSRWWRSTRTSSRCPGRISGSRALPPPPGAVGRRDREPRRRAGLPSASAAAEGQPHNAWGNLSHADRIANAVESSAEKRLLLPQICGGGSRAGPTSGMKATATALRAERSTRCST